ncbi:hypothetical protein C8F04DRAFT_1163353 [Mycena alexandri]|uniref:DUF6534 domain-containing protein n=1 Tax=Mycena alexandri TaxID=1745969 RepID=A0AAD6RVV7_9AGAR|nr:hypothetical protein C8F04DRAFT_1163353 [Mycena alexandri]
MSLSPAPDVTVLFGPMLLGVLLNTLLYGIMLVQVMVYYSRYMSDRPWFRYLVSYLVLIETVDLVCDIGIIYEPLILRYGTPEALLVSPVMLRADAVLTVLISTPTQFFIAWRIYAVTRSLTLPALIVLLSLISFGGGVATTAVVSAHPNYADFSRFHAEVITWLTSSTLCDIVLTTSLVHSLWTRKTRGGSTDSYVSKIIRLTVQTGSITAAAAMLDVIFFLAIPNTTFNFMIDFPLSKLYTNALISTLNARSWREDIVQVHATNVLFEQTTSATELHSFSTHQRRSAFLERYLFQHGSHLSNSPPSSRGTGTDSYLHNSKLVIDIAPIP